MRVDTPIRGRVQKLFGRKLVAAEGENYEIDLRTLGGSETNLLGKKILIGL